MKIKIIAFNFFSLAFCSYIFYTYGLQRKHAHATHGKKPHTQGQAASSQAGNQKSPLRKLDPNFFDKK